MLTRLTFVKEARVLINQAEGVLTQGALHAVGRSRRFPKPEILLLH